MQFKTVIAVSLLFISNLCWGVRWPALSDLMVLSCEGVNCTTRVKYLPGPVVFTEIDAPMSSNVPSTKIVPYGMHCNEGTMATGFRRCNWIDDDVHRPVLVGKCEVTDGYGWELTPDSGCEVSTNSYGLHNGAGPGGECVVFGKKTIVNTTGSYLETPWGALNAEVVANSGRTYCVKADSPPPLGCHITLSSPTIDHGAITNNSEDIRQITASLRCGVNPKVKVFGPSLIKLGNGVTTEITVTRVSDSEASIVSTLRTINADPGAYQSSFVVVVSPN
ncbi:hypothetical protein ACQKDS_06950 [Serratia sp. NPDC078593]|uniref:hypothetical protein n=1 Tax=unclassified Serratia (in: enterobacteria) TaxID=2647522 RepID=UPI0037D0A357